MILPSSIPDSRHRFGLSGRILTNSSLRMQPNSAAHISLWLIWLYEAMSYLSKLGIGSYRLPMALTTAAYRSSSQHMRQILHENVQLITEIRSQAAMLDLRLSMHLPPSCLAQQPLLVTGSSISAAGQLLEALCPQGLLIVHGMHPIHQSLAQLLSLPPAVRAMIAIEPNEHSFSLDNALELYQQCGSPIILDTLHQAMYNPRRYSLNTALRVAYSTWPDGQRPKVHVATQRTEGHIIEARAGRPAHVLAPRPGQHADFINPFEFAMLCEELAGLPGCDLMLEAKAGDMALLRLRDDLRRYAPEAHSLLEGDDAVTG